MTGPRIYNSESPEVQQARLAKKRQKRVKEVHRVRRNRLVALFAFFFCCLGLTLINQRNQVQRINAQTKSYQSSLTQLQHKQQLLQNKRNDLRDPDYVAKFLRYKFYYSKPDEKVYHIPE
ncbi:MAG: FtsB family cell division protein [Lactobacillus sp.]|nr:septum formation initiator family protein [Lactobacillus sp.]MDN6053167.1 septum formation initiator family protein [Lactobacillus sp.]